MKRSKADTAETRKRIVATASRLFLARGLAATGIADVMEAAGLTAGGFYRHFESKEQLIAEANRLAFDQLIGMFEDAVAGKAPREAIDLIVSRYLNQRQVEDPVYLCPLANLGGELEKFDEQVQAAAVSGCERLVGLLAKQTAQLEIADPAGVADAIVSTMVGAVTLSRLALEPGMAKAILANAQNVVTLLLESAPAA
ncbi:TetR/AcrR family transcriptional regulator [Cupriavidus sp. 30B13]|uniref:TetR/AcrR family transcriptional regulator n=1 Tax=Cupriavidus sp. 30B13 TaxID=3384241 RepID=UPI003B8FF116